MSTQTAENLNIINNEDQLRADMYSFLANLLRAEPSVELVNQLTKLESDESPIGKSIKTLSKLASSLDLPTIRDEYVRIFIGVGRGEILPFASYYLTGFLKDKPLAKLRNDMKEIGIQLAENVKEPEDHIASLFDDASADKRFLVKTGLFAKSQQNVSANAVGLGKNRQRKMPHFW